MMANQVEVNERVAVVLVANPPKAAKPWKVKWRGREYVVVECHRIPTPAMIQGHLCHEFWAFTGTITMQLVFDAVSLVWTLKSVTVEGC
jgi:hypothetical protein